MKRRLLLMTVLMLAVFTVSFGAKKVAFLYTEGYGSYSLDIDPVYKGLAAQFDVTPIVCDKDVEADYDMLATTYECVVFGEAMSGNTTLTNGLVNLVGRVPIVSMKAFNYTSGRWSWAAPQNPSSKCPSITIQPGFEDHALFKGLEIGTGNVIQLFDGTVTDKNMVQGFSGIIADSPISEELVYAVTSVDSYFAVHEVQSGDYKYVLVPLSSDAIQTATSNAVQLVANACNYVMGSSGFDPDAEIKIAYLYDSSYATYCGLDLDPIYNYTVIAEKEVTAIDIKDYTANNTAELENLAANYDLVVVSEAMASGHTFAKTLVNIVNRVPMLNFKSFLYKNTVWNWGAGKNPTTKASTDGGISLLKVSDDALEHEIFEGVEMDEQNQVDMFINSDPETVKNNLVQGYTATEGSLIADDNVIATVSDINAIHEHGTKNTYMLLPLSYDAIVFDGEPNLSEAASLLINNVVYYLAKSKGDVVPALAPSFTYDYGNNVTTVTIASNTADAVIYYTLDGTDPTESSNEYVEPFDVTASCTIKAIATKQGYDNSSVSSSEIVVKAKLAAPVISITAGEGIKKIVTITAAEGATIYYNLSADAPTTASAVYTEPLEISRTTSVSAIAAMDDMLDSDAATQKVDIEGYVARNKTLAWADFKGVPGLWGWIKEGTEADSAYTGDIFTAYAYTIPTEEEPDLTPLYKEHDFLNGWKVGTYGQRINLQNTGTNENVGGDYGPETSADAGATAYAMTFLVTKAKDDPCTAFLQSTETYAGPFDITVWMCGQTGSTSYTEVLEVSVSTDGNNWSMLDSLKCASTKPIRKKVAHYDGNDNVYVKITSAGEPSVSNKLKTMIFDVKLMGEGEDPVDAIELPSANVDKEVVGVQIYNVSGMQLRELGKGLNIVRRLFSDGSVEVIKVMNK